MPTLTSSAIMLPERYERMLTPLATMSNLRGAGGTLTMDQRDIERSALITQRTATRERENTSSTMQTRGETSVHRAIQTSTENDYSSNE